MSDDLFDEIFGNNKPKKREPKNPIFDIFDEPEDDTPKQAETSKTTCYDEVMYHKFYRNDMFRED